MIKNGAWVAHNPRSNMNNRVGRASIEAYNSCAVLGTDGIGADMFTEAKHAWFKARDAGLSIRPDYITGMLSNAARRASASLGEDEGGPELNARDPSQLEFAAPGRGPRR